MRPRIIHHQRLPYAGQVSIERLFAEIRDHIPPYFIVATATSSRPSSGLLSRLANLRFARRQVGDVHHILGDVHYLAFGLPAKRTVLTIHDCAALNRLSGWRREILRQLWFVQPMRRAAVVTSISQTTKDELRQWVGPLADKVLVIPNCVRSEFRPDPRPFHHETPVALQVGTGSNKNLERVAEALRGSPCRLEIVGRLTEVQRALLKDIGISYLELGLVSDVQLVDAYRGCDFVIFASLYEGFGLPILEAQATGRPIITSNCSSMPEVAGEGACLVDPLDVTSIRSGIQRVIGDADYRRTLVAAGFENVKRFQPSAIAGQYAAMYRTLLEQI